MRASGLVSVSFVMTRLLATDAEAASNRWCAVTPKRNENCATLHLTKNALALHRGMDADGGGGEIKRPPAGDADWPR